MDSVLAHHGVKGMRWGVRDGSAGSPSGGAPSASRNFRSLHNPTAKATSAKAPLVKMPSKGGTSKTASSKASTKQQKEPRFTPAQKKKIAIGVGVVGIIGLAATGTAAYKLTPKALSSMDKLSVGSQKKVAGLMAHPKVMDLKLKGGGKVNKAKLNVLFKQAEIAERTSKSPLGLIAKERRARIGTNPIISKAGINRSLGDLRSDTAQKKAMNDAESYVQNLVKKRGGAYPTGGSAVRKEAQVLRSVAPPLKRASVAPPIKRPSVAPPTRKRTASVIKKALDTVAPTVTEVQKLGKARNDNPEAMKKYEAALRRQSALTNGAGRPNRPTVGVPLGKSMSRADFNKMQAAARKIA
jgi:hypothetical protein